MRTRVLLMGEAFATEKTLNADAHAFRTLGTIRRLFEDALALLLSVQRESMGHAH